MKRFALITAIGTLALGLVFTAVMAAQGPGRGLGARAGQQGLPCPYGYEQPGGLQTGWWTRVQPTTPEQKSFVETVAGLHEQIRLKKLETARLRAANAPDADVAKAESEARGLQTQLQDFMYQNRTTRQQLGGAGMGNGVRGRGAGAGAGYGGWWNSVQPNTPEQKALLDNVQSLHSRIRDAQLEMAGLQASNASQSELAKVQAKLDGLRNELHNTMLQSGGLRQQMGGVGTGKAMCGQGAGRGGRWAR